ncbi:MAG TPA: DMT family transporter [Gaiellaceae bacterium]|nr:DMT family transporter [Gaiellaceae bacterium]
MRLARVPGVVLIAVAAAMWGSDPLLRKSILSVPASTIVFGEHVFLVLLTLPLLLPALRAVRAAGARYVAAAVVVGAGASGAATILFTQALQHDFVSAVVMQKAQPLVAVLGAAAILGERPRPRFAWFLLAGLGGLWLVNQAHPLDPSAKGLRAVLEALGAAVLWALGTVLGRYLVRRVSFEHVLALRFLFGLAASAVAVVALNAEWFAGARASGWILSLALVTGLFSLTLYYYGLQRTPAVLSSLAELTNPAVLVVAGIYAFNVGLVWSQWLGFAIIVVVVTLLPIERRRVVVERPGELVPAAASA